MERILRSLIARGFRITIYREEPEADYCCDVVSREQGYTGNGMGATPLEALLDATGLAIRDLIYPKGD